MFISVKNNVRDITTPIEKRRLKMVPMDFWEFLWALGNATLMDFIRTCFGRQKPFEQALHRKVVDDLRRHMLVAA